VDRLGIGEHTVEIEEYGVELGHGGRALRVACECSGPPVVR
jgi:hypothetical protein